VPMEWEARQPRDVAILVLRRLFGTEHGRHSSLPPREFPLAEFQEAGARRAARILEARGGVVIADAVGLGKTYVALALIEEELRRGGSVVVAIPAALRPAWRNLLRRMSPRYRPRIHVLSHALLSRGRYSATLPGSVGLVVVDEAHRFRNPATRRHAALTELCRGARVALLTATPINNAPHDLYVLLRLFLTDDAFVGLGVPSLHELFSGGTPDPEMLRRVLREVVIRRSRSMIGARDAVPVAAGQAIRFPRRAEPRIVRFEDARIPRLVAGIAALELTAYTVRPGDPGSTGVEALVRLGLLKRLESSATALASSVGRQLSFYLAFIAALEAGRLLGARHAAGPAAGREADPLQLVLIDLVAGPCPPGLDTAAILASARRDVARMRRMHRLLHGPDPKLDALRGLLASLAPERCLVFTEFRDTAEHLWRSLANILPLARIDGHGAWLGARPASRAAIVRRFAPRSNGAAEPPTRERVGVLVATDVLAEGMNLQDARHVVCYDLPWNPVRLMQRIGRVDRLGSPHDEVVPHLFLPATGLEEILGLTRRLRVKLGSIAAAMGDEESLQLLERLGSGGQGAAEAFRQIEAREDDALERLRFQWYALRDATGADGLAHSRPDGEASSPAEPRPVDLAAARLPRCCGDDPRAVALVRHGHRHWLLEVGTDGEVRDGGLPAAHALSRALQHPPHGGAPARPIARDEIDPVVRLLRRHFDVLDATGQSPPPVPPAGPSARLARLLRAALTSPVAALEPDLLHRSERVLRQLDHPLPPHTARHARALVRELGHEPSPAVILDRIEELLVHAVDRRPTRLRSTAHGLYGQTHVLVALLLVDGPERSERAERAHAR
jgi:superfamily II DNA or RNA helicase